MEDYASDSSIMGSSDNNSSDGENADTDYDLSKWMMKMFLAMQEQRWAWILFCII